MRLNRRQLSVITRDDPPRPDPMAAVMAKLEAMEQVMEITRLAIPSQPEPRDDRPLMQRLEALEPHRDALASVARWASRDPLTGTALNRETVNSMRFMLEAADIDCDGPVGSLKLQGLALAWVRVLDAWFENGFSFALETLDREIARGERYVEHVEDFARMTRPFTDMATRLFEWSGVRSKRHAPADDDYPHPSA